MAAVAVADFSTDMAAATAVAAEELGDIDDFIGILSSMIVESLWFFVGFLVMRCGLLRRILPEEVCNCLSRCGGGLLLGEGFRRSKPPDEENAPRNSSTKAVRAASKAIEQEAAAGRPEAVVKIWRRALSDLYDAEMSLPIEVLQFVAQALAMEDIDTNSMVSELLSYVNCHAAQLARPSTVQSIIEALTKIGKAAAIEKFVIAARTELGIEATVQIREALLGSLAVCGDEECLWRAIKDMRVAGQEVPARGLVAAARGFVRRSMIPAAIQAAKQMKKVGHEVPPRLVVEIMRAAGGEAHDTEHGAIAAFEALCDVGPPPAECINIVVAECARREDPKAAKMIEARSREANMAIPFSAREALLKLYVRAGDARSVDLMEEMLASGFHFTEGLCGALLAKSAEARHVAIADRVSKYLRDKQMATLATYKALMKVYASCGCYDKACDLFEMLREDDIQPDAVMYGCLMKFALKCDREELRQEIFQLAPKGDVQNYMCMMRAAGRDGDVTRAIAMLRELEATQPDVDISAYNCALDVCVSAGDLVRAEALLQEIERHATPNAITYNTLAKGYCARSQLSRARQVLRKMELAGLQPDSASYNCIIGAAISKGDLRDAWDIVSEMERKGVKVDCYTVSIMMTASKKAKGPRDAERALEMLDRSGISPCEDDVLFNTVLDACIYRRDKVRLARALAVYQDSDIRPSVHTYGLLIKAYSLLNRISTCRDLWREMVEKRCIQPTEITLSCMIDAFVCAGQVKEAVKLFRLWEYQITANTVIYSTLIKGYANNGDADSAMELYKELQANGVEMNLVAYTTLIDAQARVGNMERATELLAQMEKENCSPNTITYSTIVKGYCVRGELSQALAAFEEMLGRGLKADSVIFNTLLDGCVSHSNFELADQLLNGLVKYAVQPSNFTLSIIVKMWGKRRQLHRAFEAIRTMPSRYGFRMDPQVGTSLISVCISVGAVDRALEALEEMKSWPDFAGPDLSTYGLLITALSKQGQCCEAAALVEEALCKPGCPRAQQSGTTGPVVDKRRSRRSPTDGGVMGTEPLRQLYRALAQNPSLMETVGRPLAAKLRAAGIEVPKEAGGGVRANGVVPRRP